MHEYAVQLDMQEGVTQSQQEEVEHEEDNYNNLMRTLSDLRLMKNTKVIDLKNQRKDDISEEDTQNKNIESLRILKDQLVTKQEKLTKEIEDKKRKLETLMDDMSKM